MTAPAPAAPPLVPPPPLPRARLALLGPAPSWCRWGSAFFRRCPDDDDDGVATAAAAAAPASGVCMADAGVAIAAAAATGVSPSAARGGWEGVSALPSPPVSCSPSVEAAEEVEPVLCCCGWAAAEALVVEAGRGRALVLTVAANHGWRRACLCVVGI